MIEARALVSINFLNLSENYDFMSRWLGVYDKYAKLLKGSSDAVVKDGSGKIPESANDKVDLTNKHLALQAILAEYGQKLNKSHLYSETVGLSEAHDEGGNLAASKIRNLECPSYEICLIDYGCGKFNRKIHIMEQYP